MKSVCEQVAEWIPEDGGDPVVPDFDLQRAQAYTKSLATSHYENFPVVSLLLPKHLRQHFYNVYAYCRWADDLGDETGDTETALRLLGWWRRCLQDCYSGELKHPVFVALRPTIDEFEIPIDPFEKLIQAFEQDQHVTEYETFSQLRDYCSRSADPVGRLVLMLCRQATAQNVEWSDSICTGLQLANHWQDVSRDLKMPRIYLPDEDMKRFGFSREQLLRGETTPEFIELMRFQVDRAKEMLLAGLPLVRNLPGRLQIDIELFARGGLCILKRIEKIGYRVLETRPRVSKVDAFCILLRCIMGRICRAVIPRI